MKIYGIIPREDKKGYSFNGQRFYIDKKLVKNVNYFVKKLGKLNSKR